MAFQFDKSKLPKPCIECPFRMMHEGGCLVDYTAADVIHPFPDQQFQPCHMHVTIDCQGNIRNDMLLANGFGNGDQVRLTRDIHVTDERGVVHDVHLEPKQKSPAQIKRELAILKNLTSKDSDAL